jgi:hypothetical protein
MPPSTVDPPVRPDLHPSWIRPERRWWPLASVVAVIAVVVLGGYVTSAALSESAGPPVEIPGIVQVRPLSGWEESDAGQIPIAIQDRVAPGLFVQLTRSNGNFGVLAFRVGPVAPGTLAQAYALSVLGQRLDRPTVSRNIDVVTLGSGRALRFAYVGVHAQTGVSIEGEVTVLVTPAGDGIVFDAFAPESLLQFILGDVHAMEDDAGFFE